MIPLAIIAGCLVVIVVSVVIRRARNRRATPVGEPEATAAADGNEAPTDLGAWQTDHGHSVDRWLDAHESTLPALVPGADPTIDAELDRAMADAAAVCPNPEVSGMLAGMQATARATRVALTGGDRPAAEAAHDAYGRHRSAAIEAMQSTRRPLSHDLMRVPFGSYTDVAATMAPIHSPNTSTSTRRPSSHRSAGR